MRKTYSNQWPKQGTQHIVDLLGKLGKQHSLLTKSNFSDEGINRSIDRIANHASAASAKAWPTYDRLKTKKGSKCETTAHYSQTFTGLLEKKAV